MFLLDIDIILLPIYNQQPNDILQKLQIISDCTIVFIELILIILIAVVEVSLTAGEMSGIGKVSGERPDQIGALKHSFYLCMVFCLFIDNWLLRILLWYRLR